MKIKIKTVSVQKTLGLHQLAPKMFVNICTVFRSNLFTNIVNFYE